MMKWFKNLNVIVKSGIGIVIAFFIVCVGIYYTVLSEIPSPITNDQWVTIISTFFAGTLGGLIALGGIWWQLNHEKKETINKVNRYIRYIVIRKNINNINENDIDFEDKFINIFKELKYKNSKISSTYGAKQIKFFFELDENYISKNIDIILDNQAGEEILNLQSEIKLFNLDYHHLLVERSSEREKMLDCCKELKYLVDLKNHLQFIVKSNELLLKKRDDKDIFFIKESLKNYEKNNFTLFCEKLNKLLDSNIIDVNKELIKKGLLVIEKEKGDDLKTKIKFYEICNSLDWCSRYSNDHFSENSLKNFKNQIENSDLRKDSELILKIEKFSLLKELSKKEKIKQLSKFYNFYFNFVLQELQFLEFKSKDLTNLKINLMTHLLKDIVFCERTILLYESFNKVKTILHQ